MKRRRFLQAVATASATGIRAQQSARLASLPNEMPPAGLSKLDPSVADAGADTVVRFFTVSQFVVLQKLADILMPASAGIPGALDSRAPEFLDFLIGASSAERQAVYQAGLDGLDAEAEQRFGKPFADVNAEQADKLLMPLREPWTPLPPADPVACFLLAAKLDLRVATLNSLEWDEAARSAGQRGPSGLYWHRID